MNLTPNAPAIEAAAKLFDRTWPATAVKDLDPAALRRTAHDSELAPLTRLTALQMLISRMDSAPGLTVAHAPAPAPEAASTLPTQADLEAARQEYEITRQNLKDVLAVIYKDPEVAVYQLQNSCRYHWERLTGGSPEDREILVKDPSAPVKMAIAGMKVTPSRLGQLRGYSVLGIDSPDRAAALDAIETNLLEHALLWYPAKLSYDDMMRRTLKAARLAGQPAKAEAAPAAPASPMMERVTLEALRAELKTDAAREWVILRETNPIEAWRQAERRGRSDGSALLVDEYQSKWWMEARDVARSLLSAPDQRATLVKLGLSAAVEASAALTPPDGPSRGLK